MKQTKPNKDIITIGNEWTGEDRPSYICSHCNRDLIKLIDRSRQNTSYYCNACSIEYNPENESIVIEQNFQVPDRNHRTCNSNNFRNRSMTNVQIHTEPEIKGAFKVLQQKGIKIKDYRETDGAGRTIS